ncbi:MAG: elongation factor 4 [Planctomycetes bacterium]|nr:elongation factor 4 [Planctomycetota bacterium]
MRTEKIRNFCIIAHVDHGKSTLADRLLQKAKAIDPREFRDQVLDDMDLERERGITIKAKAVVLSHQAGGETYCLNLIDTPGHVDFSYEVSRSLAACEGVLLVVDASQGVQAQTVANFYLALEHDLAIIPVINKIDMQMARPQDVSEEMEKTLGMQPGEIIRASAKEGIGIDEIFDAIVKRIPPPKGKAHGPLRALIFDSVFNDYRGVIVYIRVVDGTIKRGDSIAMMKTGHTFVVDEVGVFSPTKMIPRDKLSVGEVGYCIANIKSIHDVKVGDTITSAAERASTPLPGYKEPLPMVFCGLYPTVDTNFHVLREALEKLSLNDSAFSYEPETSQALGFGFRCGFLGLLHMEIVQERLERESKIDLVQTAPNVTYEVLTNKAEVLRIENPAALPEGGVVEEIREPMVRASLILPADCIGIIMRLAEDRRGRFVRQEYLSPTRAILTYDLPLAEIIYDFYDKLKSATRGYGTMDYEFTGFEAADLVKLDILVAQKRVDAFSSIVHRSEAETRGRRLVKKLRKEIDRHLFEVVLQAAIGTRIIARESIAPLSKHVTGKCYGGDITRKRKLWAKQREGKKRLKQIGQVEIPQQAFLSVLAKD